MSTGLIALVDDVVALAKVAAETSSFRTQAFVLAIIGIGGTLVLYGAVAPIVKADDAGLSLARNDNPASSLLGVRGIRVQPNGADRALRPLTQGLGRGLVAGMPYFLQALSAVGTAAMLWVGGGIIIHGVEEFGLTCNDQDLI